MHSAGRRHFALIPGIPPLVATTILLLVQEPAT